MMQKIKQAFGVQDMTVGRPMDSLVRFSIPLLLGNLAQQLYNTVDSIVVGKYVGDTALAAVGVSSAVFHLAPLGPAAVFVLCFLSNMALLGVGMGLFNLIPISPLDGSKILFALLPDRAYYTILRYEKYVMGVLIVLVLLGAFDRPLSFLMLHILQGFCAVTGMPMGALLVFQDAASIFQLF